MNYLKNLSENELKEYCIKIKKNGASFGEIARVFNEYEVSDNLKQSIMLELNNIDKIQKEAQEIEAKKNTKINGIYWFIIGLAIFLAGTIIFFWSSKVGVIFIFSIAAWLIGGILSLQGIVLLIRGLKSN
ncbi:MAG TPA: hypothetical protein VKZ45_04985 [Vicingaceae bacterium]|nr:hypothetical protein [Vicingaceae bacterium]